MIPDQAAQLIAQHDPHQRDPDSAWSTPDPVGQAADDAADVAVRAVDAWHAVDDAAGLERPSSTAVVAFARFARTMSALEAATDYRRRT